MIGKNYYDINEKYNEKYDLIVGAHYSSEGIIPCLNNCKTCYISSSGNTVCIGYRGHTEVKTEDTEFFIIRCKNGAECHY